MRKKNPKTKKTIPTRNDIRYKYDRGTTLRVYYTRTIWLTNIFELTNDVFIRIFFVVHSAFTTNYSHNSIPTRNFKNGNVQLCVLYALAHKSYVNEINKLTVRMCECVDGSHTPSVLYV